MDQLKQAERQASTHVEGARKARVDRMKEAKLEAEAQINAYRAELEAAYQAKTRKQSGSANTSASDLDSKTKNDIANFEREFARNSEAVEKMLLNLVTTVQVSAPAARS